MGGMRAVLIVMSMVLMTNQVSAGKRGLGEGGVSCGAWLEARRSRSEEAWRYQAWVLGCVSGANEYRGGDDFLDADAPAVFAWLDNYCPQHSLDKLFDASDMLIKDLTMRAAVAATKTK
jgi:hypothetical protein